jgi:hypothetical protein
MATASKNRLHLCLYLSHVLPTVTAHSKYKNRKPFFLNSLIRAWSNIRHGLLTACSTEPTKKLIVARVVKTSSGSSPCSQQPVTCPYPEQQEASPHLSIPLQRLFYYNLSIFCYVFQVASSFQLSQTNLCSPMHFLSLPFVLYAVPISSL